MAKKTDNSAPTAKLDLRRYFLDKYHADDPPSVMDCCQGDGLLWKQLRKEYDVPHYWGIDVKPKKGRLKIDSVRVLAQAGWTQNVIDIDTYGSPWKHWAAMLPNITGPTTVFLTVGRRNIAHGNISPVMYSYQELEAIGVRSLMSRFPRGIAAVLLRNCGGIVVSRLLTMGCDYATIVEAAEPDVSGRQATRYIGVRLEPGKTNGHGGNRGRSKPKQANKEPAHV